MSNECMSLPPLKPCPFCGFPQIALYQKEDGYRFKVCCFNCSAQIYRGTEEEVINAWNMRAGESNE